MFFIVGGGGSRRTFLSEIGEVRVGTGRDTEESWISHLLISFSVSCHREQQRGYLFIVRDEKGSGKQRRGYWLSFIDFFLVYPAMQRKGGKRRGYLLFDFCVFCQALTGIWCLSGTTWPLRNATEGCLTPSHPSGQLVQSFLLFGLN